MRLDCIEGSELREPSELWIIIDHDNNAKEFACGDTIDNAWYLAAMRLQIRINDAVKSIRKTSIILES